jgi:hypothetical protein
MQNSVAVTYSWNRMAYIINRSLSVHGIKVFTGDTSWLNMNRFSLHGNRSFRYPEFYGSKELFITYINDYLGANNIPFLIPTHEEIFIISKYKDQFNNIKTLVPEFNSLRTAHKKNLSATLANELNIPIPQTIKPLNETDCISFFNENDKPVVLKYENSNSSKGVFYITDMRNLQKHFSAIGEFILQEYVDGVGYGVSMLYNQGKLRASFTHKRLEEKISTGGTSTVRVSIRNEQLEEYAKTLLDHLTWNGVAMVEFKWNEAKKKGWFIEINPRFWGSLALPYYAGMDIPWHYYCILRDGDIDPVFDYKEGVVVKWLLGGALGFLDGVINEKQLNWHHLSLKADYFDDFRLRDPFIILGEMGYYLEKFLQSMKLNPTKNSSLDIDNI